MTLEEILRKQVQEAVKNLYQIDATEQMIQLQKTRPEFEGNITLVVFPFVKMARKAPAQVAQEIGEYITNSPLISSFNAVQGFLNMTISQQFWISQLQDIYADANYGTAPDGRGLMMVEYSSPNTNKPLHLGRARNNLLGYSIAKIQEANGWQVVKTNIVNDRGIHICKSMLAWLRFGNGETPESSGKKGDHLIGDYYVRFDKE
ncbi:MAG: arginine--tRNA ligase, partial [Bacteroidales bacterium]|nr:arginine--tRNA ligase [Bacteroidales bacterium]